MGIVFPWAISRAVVRQERLAEQLEDTQRQLAQQALAAERREIARDVHDFVGHGLAAVMLQVYPHYVLRCQRTGRSWASIRYSPRDVLGAGDGAWRGSPPGSAGESFV